MTDVPDYESWKHYCFTQGYADFSGNAEDPESAARYDRFMTMKPKIVAEYLARLFDQAGSLADVYTPGQLAEGTWFICGVASSYFLSARDPTVPVDLQVRVFRAMPRMYLDLYDKLCARRGTSAEDLSDSDKLDMAVYMIWDMDCIESALMFPEKTLYLVDPGFDILQAVLDRCQTGACVKSALHGLGHLQSYYPDRVESMIDNFLTNQKGRLPDWLVEYARIAREGRVQ